MSSFENFSSFSHETNYLTCDCFHFSLKSPAFKLNLMTSTDSAEFTKCNHHQLSRTIPSHTQIYREIVYVYLLIKTEQAAECFVYN